ncbi:helix-turn-helix domain-containing protein [Mycobacterium sp. OTB74]|jgi:transposase-like protein|uniref:helix-turn-helix domain-containing protein n=1 Tax=Mycobacterium sp. OTB74 TaxID=1853452 RepID=UPI00247331D9|nr:helix-turn-helix domain-containing protein [Mycobacterium sp. OTB74]MDH6242706.1 transposase-like protein [Mycobacterium sp. OTB74]
MQRYSNLDALSKFFQKLCSDGLITPDGRVACRSDRFPEVVRPFKLDQRLNDQIRAEIVALYRSGEPSTAIGATYGLNKNSVIKVLREAGIPIRRQSLTSEQIDDAIRLYRTGQSLATIGRQLGVDHGTVWRALRKRRVKLRDTHGRDVGSPSPRGEP